MFVIHIVFYIRDSAGGGIGFRDASPLGGSGGCRCDGLRAATGDEPAK